MRLFEVHYKGFKVVHADSLEQANEIVSEQGFLDTTSFFDIQEQTSHEVIGHCELSGLSIFDGDDYEYDKFGVMWLKGKEVE